MMKTQIGITLISLVVYITVFMIVISILTTVSNYFHKNVNSLQKPLGSVTGYNQFHMFFVNDAKKNHSATITENGTKLEFEDGTVYVYASQKLFRNNIEIVDKIRSLKFTLSSTNEGDVKKNIVNVQMTFTNDARVTKDSIDYVLKYW